MKRRRRREKYNEFSDSEQSLRLRANFWVKKLINFEQKTKNLWVGNEYFWIDDEFMGRKLIYGY